MDNIESLLTAEGAWRDERWGLLIDALTDHSGLARVVLTSRRRPVLLDARVLAEPVHALSRDEAVLLARELPNLGALIAGNLPPSTAPGRTAVVSPERGRELAVRVLAAAQGHPKLLELADGQAGDPARLEELLGERGPGVGPAAGSRRRGCSARSRGSRPRMPATMRPCWTAGRGRPRRPARGRADHVRHAVLPGRTGPDPGDDRRELGRPVAAARPCPAMLPDPADGLEILTGRAW